MHLFQGSIHFPIDRQKPGCNASIQIGRKHKLSSCNHFVTKTQQKGVWPDASEHYVL